jgi:membrane protein YdbS with pleckstrin-like domain
MKTMSPAGSTSEAAPKGFPNLRPVVTKTYLKGFIGLGAFSLFMQLSLANLVNYLIFLTFSIAVLTAYVIYKRSSAFEVGEDSINVWRPARRKGAREFVVPYDAVVDVSVAQGLLARRFNCGSVYLILKDDSGNTRLLGGGSAERLQDVPNPYFVYQYVTERLGPFAPR